MYYRKTYVLGTCKIERQTTDVESLGISYMIFLNFEIANFSFRIYVDDFRFVIRIL